MARYALSAESQTAQLAGAPSGTTFNGYFAAVMAGANAGFRLRRLNLGVRAGASVPTSQQVTVGLYRQTVAVAGTGQTTTAGVALEVSTNQTSSIGGLLITTAASAGTTGPTIAANPIDTIEFNTQSYIDVPYDYIEELTCNLGTANGIAFVNLGNTLPTNHFVVLTPTIEV
jgi:hypothetical protein